MTNLSKSQLLFVAMLLDQFSEELGNHGCNDMPEEWKKIIPDEEWAKLAVESVELGVAEDGETLEETKESICSFDFVATSLFAKKIRKIAELKE